MWQRCRFKSIDTMPVKFPPPAPYCCTGSNIDCCTIVTYVKSIDQVLEYWPDAIDIEAEEVEEIVYSSRFPKPEWYTGDSHV